LNQWVSHANVVVTTEDKSQSCTLPFSDEDVQNNFQGHCITLSAKKIFLKLNMVSNTSKLSGFHSCQLQVRSMEGISVQQRQETIDFSEANEGKEYTCDILLQEQLNSLEFIVKDGNRQHSFVIMVFRI
jgi:hypothetical protein